jgi:Ni2+-binding GTPase involved in maturation of urease and hydrogenase
MRLIALHGPLGSGKTTIAEVMVNNYGYRRVSFAAPLYDMLEAGGFGRPKTQAEKAAVIERLSKILGKDITWRHAAQTLGTEWGRNCLDERIWGALALAKCNDPDGAYVIDDLRFENEAQMVREAGGLVVHIDGRKGDAGLYGVHQSETPLRRAMTDYVFDNSSNGSTELLKCIEDLLYCMASR